MSILKQEPSKSTTQPPNIVKPTAAPNSLAEAYAQQFEIKLNKYKPSDKSFILINMTVEPIHEMVRSFVRGVAADAEEQWGKICEAPPIKNSINKLDSK